MHDVRAYIFDFPIVYCFAKVFIKRIFEFEYIV